MSDMTPGEQLRAAIRDAGLTQAQAAERLKVSQQTISAWCRDVVKPGALQKVRIKLALGLDPDIWGEAISAEERAELERMAAAGS